MYESEESPPPGKSITELPNEVLLTIFSYLPTSDIKYNIANVCMQWAALSKDKKLWRSLTFKTTSKATKAFGIGSWFSTLRFLSSTPELRSLVISSGHSESEVVEILKIVNECCTSLKHITFEYDMGIAAGHMEGLTNIFDNVESLQVKLKLSALQELVFKTLLLFKKLRKVVFVGIHPDFKSFETFIHHTTTVEHINVARVNFSKENFMSLYQEKHKFVSLGIKLDKLDEKCLKLIALFPRLNDLELSDGNVSYERLSIIGKLQCLSCLHLQETASSPVLTGAALAKFFNEGSFPNLMELKLHKSRLNDEAAAEIRRNCTNLTYLEVMTYPRSISSMTDKALLHFLHCKKLSHFEVLFDNSEEVDWVYRRIRYFPHDCDVDDVCSIGLEGMLEFWDELHIPVD